LNRFTIEEVITGNKKLRGNRGQNKAQWEPMVPSDPSHPPSFRLSNVVRCYRSKNCVQVFCILREPTMSIFGKIMSAIFGTSAGAAPAGGAATTTAGGSAAGSSSAPVAPAQSVDVAPILDKAVAAKKEKLEWRTSIVDLMKALDIDSSLGARKELAKELGYTGDTNDSASMNIWLHKQVMAKLAANGGKLPPEIKH
jgi:hypothetical protein